MNTPDPTRTTTARPWHRESIMWLVVAIPLATVVGGFVTLTLAVRGADDVVRDDYRTEGLSIHADPRRDAAAAAAGVTATLRLDPVARIASVDLVMARGTAPDDLLLLLSHSTIAREDRMLHLRRGDTGYAAELGPLAAGHWYAEITPPDRSWRVIGDFRGSSATLTLVPGHAR